MRPRNALKSADPDVRHPTATGTRIQITQFASAQGGALATKLPTHYNDSLLYVYDAGMAADRDQLAVCAVPGRKAEVAASASSGETEAVVTRGCCHAAVGVWLTGSRTVLSPKSATRSSRPPRAST